MEWVHRALSPLSPRPLTPTSLLAHYAPLKGALCFVWLGSHMLSPECYEGFRFLYIPRVMSLPNALLTNSVVCGGLYLYGRPHLANMSPGPRAFVSLTGSALVSLGALLSWALIRSALVAPGAEVTGGAVAGRAVLGAVSAGAVLAVVRCYVNHVDDRVTHA